MTTRKHYVTFISPGTFVPEITTKEIAEWDPRIAVGMAEAIVERYGARPYGFRFITQLVADPVADGEGGTLDVRPKVVEQSGIHFLGGRIDTIEDVEARNDPKESILLSNMTGGTPLVIDIVRGFRSVLPFEEKDVVVDATGAITARGDDPERIAYRASKVRP